MKAGCILLSPRGISAWITLAAGLLMTTLLTSWLYENRQENAAARFGLIAADVINRIEKRLNDHEQILLGGAGLFDATGTVSRQQWHAYVSRLRLEYHYPGIQGVGFSQAIAPADLPRHIQEIRNSGFPDYQIRPLGERTLYTAIIYLEPFAGRNLAAFGFDMYSEPTRRDAMQRAVNGGMTSISGKVALVQETHGPKQAGFLMYVPVYQPYQPLTTPAERWQALRGFVYSPYRMDDLMRGILGDHGPFVDITIHDAETLSDESLMYDSASLRQTPQTTSFKPRFRENKTIRAFGHGWTISIVNRPAFLAKFESPLDVLIPVLGTGASLFLFALLVSTQGRRESAMALAADMSARRAESEERFHQLFLHLGQGVVIHQADGRISDANPAAQRILGLDLDQMRGTTSSDLRWHTVREDGTPFDGKDHPATQALHQGVPVTDVAMGVWHELEGNWRWIRVDAYPRFSGSDQPAQQVYAVFTDITAQRLADEEVRSARKRLSDVLSAASDIAIIATDTSGLITIFNTGAERMLGYSSGDIAGRHTLERLHLPDELLARCQELSAELGRPVSGFQALVEKAMRQGSETREWTYVRQDGSQLPVSLLINPIRDRQGVTGFLGVAQDITLRRQAEQALREQASHTQAILDHIMDGIITINASGLIQTVNPSAIRVFGYTEQEMLGRNVSMLMPNPHRDAHDQYLRNFQQTRQARIIGVGREVEGQRKDGSLFPMELAVSEVFRQGVPFYVGMVRDITERKRVDRMKSEFVSTVSHELRTPLTAISGALGLIFGGATGKLPDKAAELISIAYKNSQRLSSLINDLLDMEKLVAGKMSIQLQVQPLQPLIRDALEMNRAYGSERNIQLRLTRDIPAVNVAVDSQRLMQILSNLLSNAIKFSPAGATIDIDVTTIPHHQVRISVTDRGPGIPAAFRERIFQKFAQADSSDTRQKGGTGLGLAISRELAERMQGGIGFESEEGHGSCFYLDLPLSGPGQVLQHDDQNAHSTQQAKSA
ncbi:MAG: CHASE domain-containing protein [Pseudomonadota bacterium]